MKPFKNWAPTRFDCKGNGPNDIQNFMVLTCVGQNRDSGCLPKSNFRSALRDLGGESETIQVHRFGHWGPGWFEIILIDPKDEEKIKIAEEIENKLADYPILCEEDHSELEMEDQWETWKTYVRRDLINLIEQKFSIALHVPDLPSDDSGTAFEHLFYQKRSETDTYWETDDEGSSIKLEAIVEAIKIEDVIEWVDSQWLSEYLHLISNLKGISQTKYEGLPDLLYDLAEILEKYKKGEEFKEVAEDWANLLTEIADKLIPE